MKAENRNLFPVSAAGTFLLSAFCFQIFHTADVLPRVRALDVQAPTVGLEIDNTLATEGGLSQFVINGDDRGSGIDPATGYQSIFGQPYAVNPSVPNGSPNVAGQDVGIAVTPGAYTNDWNYQPYERIKENYVSATMNYDLDFATARSITGYTDFTANRSADNDQSSKTFAAFGYGSGIQEPHDHARTFTQELQLASRATTPLQWIVGAYYLHDKIFEIYEQKILPASLGVGSYKENAWLTTEAYAGYAQGSYFVVPEQLRLIAGVRYSHEKKSFHFQNFFTAPPGTYDFGTPDTDTTGAPSFSSWTWRAGAEYTPSRRGPKNCGTSGIGVADGSGARVALSGCGAKTVFGGGGDHFHTSCGMPRPSVVPSTRTACLRPNPIATSAAMVSRRVRHEKRPRNTNQIRQSTRARNTAAAFATNCMFRSKSGHSFNAPNASAVRMPTPRGNQSRWPRGAGGREVGASWFMGA